MTRLHASLFLPLTCLVPLALHAPAPVPLADEATATEREVLTSAEVDAALTGTWIVDLTPRPSGPYHEARLLIDDAGGGVVEGTFYGSPLEGGLTNALWGPLHLGFTTRDGSAAYHTSAELVGEALQGTTRSSERDSLWVWTAKRAD